MKKDKLEKVFETKDALIDIENKMKQHVQVVIPTEHTIMGGVYIRQIAVPAGTLIMGKRHRHATCNFLASGQLLIYMGPDEPSKMIEGPLMFESSPGTKKFAYCHTDVVFMNIHPTNLTDIDEIEKEVIITDKEYEQQLLEEGE